MATILIMDDEEAILGFLKYINISIIQDMLIVDEPDK
jgi:hypothetical protein